MEYTMKVTRSDSIYHSTMLKNLRAILPRKNHSSRILGQDHMTEQDMREHAVLLVREPIKALIHSYS